MAELASNTQPLSWPVQKLRRAIQNTSSEGPRVELPKFQRSLVWGPDQKRELIESILSGFPIGSFLLWAKPGGDNGITHQLIDGLQRTTAILNYYEKPLTFLPIGNIPQEMCEAAAVALKPHVDCTAETVQQVIETWLSRTQTIDRSKGFDTIDLVGSIARELAVETADLVANSELVSALREVLNHLEKICNIDNVEIPVLVYEGSEANLSEIFERLNSKGTKLSKYDRFAATWVDQETEVTEEDLVSAIKNRYRKAIEQGYEIQGVGPGLEIDEFSLFEYLFGLGKVLGSRHEPLFEPAPDSSETESIGFTLASVCHGIPLSAMSALPATMKGLSRSSSGRIDPSRFQRSLEDACQFVGDSLKPYVGIKLNKVRGDYLRAHGEYQIASLVASVFALKYDPNTWEVLPEWPSRRDTLRATIPQHYLFDLIWQVWRGTGDKRLFERVWERKGESNQRLVPSTYYLRTIERAEWERTLQSWLAQQLQKSQTERGRIDNVQRVFLAFLYANRLTHHDLHANTFEIEHVVPVSRIADLVRSSPDSEGWPISAMGNLALFIKKTNREKSKRTVPEYLASVKDEKARAAKRTEIEGMLFCPIESADIGSAYDRESFKHFVRGCFGAMQEELLQVLRIE